MISAFKKNWSLISIIAVIVIAGIGGYYVIRLKQGPYRSSDFVSIQYSWGLGDTLVNSYNSATGHYQYLNNKDSLVVNKFKLRTHNMIYLHSKANELNLWTLPDVIANRGADLKSNKILRYEMVFNYVNKTKKIIFMSDYDGDPQIAQTASALQKLVESTITEAEDRYTNH
ncbi:hypothetical protein VRU48_02390 [Pedobacter sp. KR3-3]|uniref:Uncharacterized protein n=1 Tax=Pedobacter albus TaxID=3113905 RepID=A0ABU7I3G8_9SPHI|nr:hypothetical protein [Pedobacter sp. KR3-3]MEE1943939.1 hypothetical protein [Pedobacter sp. KR3-3]